LQAQGGVVADALSHTTTHVIVSSKAEPAARTAQRLASAIAALCGRDADDPAHAELGAPVARTVESAALEKERLRNKVAFVTAAWVSSSLASAKQLPVTDYIDPAASEGIDAALQPAADSVAQADVKAEAANPHTSSRRDAAAHDRSVQLATPRAAAVVPDLDVALQASSNAGMRAPHTTQVQAVGSDGLKPPGAGLTDWQPAGWTAADWGAGGVWLEPFALSSVQDTLGQLYRHYHRLDLQTPGRSDRPPSASQSPVSNAVTASHTSAAPPASKVTGAPVGAVAPCEHAACAHASVCIVRELEKTTEQYVKGRGVDTFRLFATKRAVGMLLNHTQPLATDEDVDRLQLGARVDLAAAEICNVMSRALLCARLRTNDFAMPNS
jgi:hypothetical protein